MSVYLPCPSCGERATRDGRVCSQCRLEASPTPLYEHLRAHGLRLVDVQEAAGISERASKMALHGERLGVKVATKIADVTGLDADELMRGVPREGEEET